MKQSRIDRLKNAMRFLKHSQSSKGFRHNQFDEPSAIVHAESRNLGFSLHPVEASLLDTIIGYFFRRCFRSGYYGDNLISLDKTMGFYEDEQFVSSLTRQASKNDEIGRAWRAHTLIWAARKALKLEGDLVECGTYRGFLSSMVVDCANPASAGKKIYLYDTFEGFSGKYSSKEDFKDFEGFYDFAQKVYGKPGIYESVVERFSSHPEVVIVKGTVPESFSIALPEKISYLHVDLNSPEAERLTYEKLFDRLSPGACVILDDYGWLVFRKQKEVADEFFKSKGLEVLELPTGQGLVVI